MAKKMHADKSMSVNDICSMLNISRANLARKYTPVPLATKNVPLILEGDTERIIFPDWGSDAIGVMICHLA